MSTAAIAILVAITGIICTALVAGIGAVWRLGSKVGRFEAVLMEFERACRQDREAHETWTKDVIAAIRELDGRITATNERLGEAEGRLTAIERVCQERRENSMRFAVPPDDDSGGVPSGSAGCG